MTKHQPTVSVVTPAYNAARFIEETMDSVRAQTYQDWEMIVVDDQSTDKTVELVKQYEQMDSRIHLVQLEQNSGSAIARNTAMDHAKGKYIAFLDSDDRWLPEKLTKQLHFMQENDLAFTFTKYIRMHESGELTNGVSRAPVKLGYDDLMKRCVIGCLTVMIDREKIGEERMVNIRTRQDYAFWLTITRKGFNAYGLPEVLAEYRLVADSISSNKIKAAKRNWYVFRKVEKQPLHKALWYFVHYAVISVMDMLKYKWKS